MSDTITEIALEQLHESPFNHRTLFTGLEELAANIRAEGRIHEPLLVRPLVGLTRIDGTPGDQFEIVFGHRRYRAAGLAGLATVPCMVRALSDAEARAAQAAENLQRENVHALEEAEAYRRMTTDDGLSADAIAERIGKSRSHVYGRLKLLALVPRVREACLRGEIQAEVALLIARLRTEKLQEKALGYIAAEYRANLQDGGQASYRAIRDLLAERFTLALKGAIFDPADENLLPLAGSCTACPKRTGNAPEFQDLVDAGGRDGERISHRGKSAGTGADVCTDPDCFAEKKKAHLAAVAAALEAKGKTVVNGGKARAAIGADGKVKGAYVPLAEVKDALKKAKAGAAPEVVTILDQRSGKAVQAVARSALEEAGVKVKAAPKRNESSYAEDQKRWEAERRAKEAKAEVESAARARVLDAVLQAMATTPRTVLDLQAVAARCWAGIEWRAQNVLGKKLGLRDDKAVDAYIASLDVDQLGLFCMQCALFDDVVYTDSKPDALLAAAAQYGVDVQAARAEPGAPAPAADTPSKAARAPKGKRAQAELVEEGSAA